MRTSLLLIIFATLFFTLSAQDEDVITFGKFFAKKAGGEAILRGKVTDPETGEPLEGARIIIPEIDLYTRANAQGEYALFMGHGEYTVEVSYLGRTTKRQKILIYDDGVLDFGLGAQAYSLREVIIESTMDDHNVETSSAGVNELKITEIRALPTFLGEVDVVKTLLLLPGVSTVGEGASGFNVRGGNIDQNLIQLNGATLFNPSHVLGFFSAFNSDVVDKFTLYKGSVPAQFGGRASSVLDIFAKNGDFNKFKFKGGLGLVSSRFVAEGPIVKEKTSFLLGGRLSYSDWLLKLVKQPDIRNSSASFYDANAIITHRFNFNHQLIFSFYSSNDLFRYSQDFGYEYGTQLGTLQWKGILGEKFSTTSFVSIGDYNSRSFIPTGVDAFSLNNGIRYYQLKQNFLFVPSKHMINFGVEGNLHSMKPDKLEPYGDRSTVSPDQVDKDRSRDIALYFNDEYEISNRFSVNLGLRYSFYQQIGAEQQFLYEGARTNFNIVDTLFFDKGKVVQNYGGLEPRISLRLKPLANGSIKLAYNRIRQYIHLISNSTAPTPVDIWQVSTPYIPPQIADNISLGYYHNFNNNVWETSFEVYYKDIQNIIDYKDFPILLLNNHIETDLISGKGMAYGGELYIRRKVGLITGWLSYTYSRSKIKLDSEIPAAAVNNGEWYPTSYDQPHSLTLVLKRQWGKKSFFSFNFTYRSGRPISGLVTNYIQNHSPLPHFSERNRYRIPDYYRVDISLFIGLKKDPTKKLDNSIAISFYNLLGRRNAFSVFYKRPDGVLVPRAFQLSVLGSVFPSITYNFSF